MELSEQELRSMIRDAIARQRGSRSHDPADTTPRAIVEFRGHASHAVLPVMSGGDECIIEPSVRCDHCGYCKSLGH